NANPPALEYNIPTKVAIQGAAGLAPGAVRYPAGKKEKFGFEDAPLLVYDGAVEVTVPLAAAAGARSQTLSGTVEFQACNDQLCLAPASVPFSVAVTVTAAASGGTPAPAESTTTAAPDTSGGTRTSFSSAPPSGTSGASSTRNRLEAALARGGLGWFLA